MRTGRPELIMVHLQLLHISSTHSSFAQPSYTTALTAAYLLFDLHRANGQDTYDRVGSVFGESRLQSQLTVTPINRLPREAP